ncbi:hypothetical protein ACFVZR_06940 [Streptomyces sp. NPDC058316]|uniref:hypothetical protein n=1 Tax=unclassified Streptomyces TaxID=2593676 RepID=UPI00332C11B5
MSVASRRPRLVDEANRYLPDVSGLATRAWGPAAHPSPPADHLATQEDPHHAGAGPLSQTGAVTG